MQIRPRFETEILDHWLWDTISPVPFFFYNAHFTHPFPLTDNNYERIIYNMNAFQNDFYSLPGFEQFSTLTNATFGFPSPLQTKLVRPRYLFFQPNHEGNI